MTTPHPHRSWLADSVTVLAFHIRHASSRDEWYRPSPCRVYNPDGTLREVLDPFTRKPIKGAS